MVVFISAIASSRYHRVLTRATTAREGQSGLPLHPLPLAACPTGCVAESGDHAFPEAAAARTIIASNARSPGPGLTSDN
jgi:hypothetical protein